MYQKIIQIFKYYWHIQSSGISKEIHLRLNLGTSLLGSLCFFYLHLVSFQLIINRFKFSSWDPGQLWVLLFTFEIFTYLAFFLFWRGMNKTPEEINQGTFDIILAKPLSARLLAFFRNGSLHNLLSAFLGVGYLIFSLINYHLPTSLIGVALYVLTLTASLWIFHCLSVLFICLNFRHGYLPGTTGVPFEVQEIYKYPANIFSSSVLWLRLLVIPLAALTTIPTASLLLKPLDLDFILIYLLTFIILTIWSQVVWSSSLRRYSSASS